MADDKTYNIILTGAHEVGKSALMIQFVVSSYSSNITFTQESVGCMPSACTSFFLLQEKSFTEKYVSTYGRDFVSLISSTSCVTVAFIAS